MTTPKTRKTKTTIVTDDMGVLDTVNLIAPFLIIAMSYVITGHPAPMPDGWLTRPHVLIAMAGTFLLVLACAEAIFWLENTTVPANYSSGQRIIAAIARKSHHMLHINIIVATMLFLIAIPRLFDREELKEIVQTTMWTLAVAAMISAPFLIGWLNSKKWRRVKI